MTLGILLPLIPLVLSFSCLFNGRSVLSRSLSVHVCFNFYHKILVHECSRMVRGIRRLDIWTRVVFISALCFPNKTHEVFEFCRVCSVLVGMVT